MKQRVIPAILAQDKEAYDEYIRTVASFSDRVHIDITDGVFAESSTVSIDDIWWPAGVRADIHVMYKRPDEIMDTLIALKPHMIIVHAEAEGDFLELAKRLHANGIRAGIALLPETAVQYITPGVGSIDHVMLFSGSLGSYGGTANYDLLSKVPEIRALDGMIEIGWDGGVSDESLRKIADSGIEAIVSGGFISKADSPYRAYTKLKGLLEE